MIEPAEAPPRTMVQYVHVSAIAAAMKLPGMPTEPGHYLLIQWVPKSQGHKPRRALEFASRIDADADVGEVAAWFRDVGEAVLKDLRKHKEYRP